LSDLIMFFSLIAIHYSNGFRCVQLDQYYSKPVQVV